VAAARPTLDQPFFVLATQNPLEMEGTYPLPEAQLDRFFFKLHVDFPDHAALHTILDRTTSDHTPEPQPVIDQGAHPRAARARAQGAAVALDPGLRGAGAAGDPPRDQGATTQSKKYLRYGASPRGLQAIILAAKIRALLEGRYAVAIDDIRAVALPALRHRLILNFEGEAEGVKRRRHHRRDPGLDPRDG
jgi:MoxR-like ATPase